MAIRCELVFFWYLSGMAFFLRPLQPGILCSETFRIPRGEHVLRVGRDEGNELRVDHSSVSSLHARIEVKGGSEVAVVDCGSSNGTFVNGIRIERHPLADGDLLRFATAEFRVHVMGNGSHKDAEDPGVAPEDPAVEEEQAPLAFDEATNETRIDDSARERESLGCETERLLGEVSLAKEETGRMRAELDRRDAEAVLREGRLRAQDEELRRLRRELEDAARREERTQANLSEARRETMDREGAIAALRYEIDKKEAQVRQLDGERARLQKVCDDYALAWDELQARFAAAVTESEAAQGARQQAERETRALLERSAELGTRLLLDWRGWLEPGEEPALSPDLGADEVFARLERVAARIRGELDRIEPIWFEFGAGVQDELARRCGALRGEEGALADEVARRNAERAALEADLVYFREQLDAEVRRAQGLSRRGIEVEIPERFESMVIARDREQEVYRALVERLETLDLLLEGYRRSRKLRGVHRDLAEFRHRIAAILEAGGVGLFEIETGTQLTLKHRREVQVLGRKGWGTRQYSEQPFQPGEVVKVVRPGYRIGEGDGAVILRKVEVLIRGVDG